MAPASDGVASATGPRFGRGRAGRVIALLVVWLTAMGLTAPAPAAAQAHDGAAESAFVTQVNEVRARAGVAPLTVDPQLRSLARGWTAEMHAGNCGGGAYICHASPISSGVTHEWAKLGENVGTGPDVTSVTDAFVQSPGHYANMIDPDFTHIGVGVMWDGARLYTTHRFMAIANAPAPEEAAATPAPEPAPTSQPEATPVEDAEAPAPAEAAPTPQEAAPPASTPEQPLPTRAPSADAERVAVVVEALDAIAA